jgi:hypothetical protein
MEPEYQGPRKLILGLCQLCVAGVFLVVALLADRVGGLGGMRPDQVVALAVMAVSALSLYGPLGWSLGRWLWSRRQVGAVLLDLGPREEHARRWWTLRIGGNLAMSLACGVAALLVASLTPGATFGLGVLCLGGATGLGAALRHVAHGLSRTQIRDGGIVAWPEVVVPWAAIAAYEVRPWSITVEVRSRVGLLVRWGLLPARWYLAVRPEEGQTLEPLLAQRVAVGRAQAGWLRPST